MKWIGWRLEVNCELPEKCVICVAPHTSNWDFLLGEVASRSVGYKAGFLMKKTWFFFPLGYLLKAIGGVPVVQHAHTHVTDGVIKAFAERERLAIAITPEGTRSRNPHWHKGVVHIAREAKVPILMGYFDYPARIVCLDRIFEPGDDINQSMAWIKDYYKTHGKARYPEKFTT